MHFKMKYISPETEIKVFNPIMQVFTTMKRIESAIERQDEFW